MQDTLGGKLRKLRREKKWTLQEVADRLGLRGLSTYSNWEYDRTKPDPEMLARLAKVFSTDVDYLVGAKKEERSDNALPESEIERIIKEAEAHYNVNLHDDPVVLAAMKQMIDLLAKAKIEK